MPDEKEIYYKWFIEGFTNYYANLINLRTGLISFEEYVNQYNKTISDYYSSPTHSLTMSELEKDYFISNDTMQLPYRQGEILAHNWNTEIKKLTSNQKSLDDVMRSLLNFVNTHKQKLTLEELSHIATEYKKENVINDIKQIYAGHLVVPSQDSLGPCVVMENMILPSSTKPIPQFILVKNMWEKDPKKCLEWFEK